MTTLTLDSQSYAVKDGDSVLTTLLSNNINIPYACQQGICQSCMIRSPKQTPPADSQIGLSDTQQARNCFLACQCHPTEDMTLEIDASSQDFVPVTVKSIQALSDDVIELILSHPEDFDFRAGQFINLKRHDGLARSYSIANCKNSDNTLELHIRQLPNGQFSEWAHKSLKAGDPIEMQGPFGDCFYVQNDPAQPLLLIGTGTGLAPLAGVLFDALAQGHTGPINLFHGSREPNGLYWIEKLRALEESVPNFHYHPCLSSDTKHPDFQSGRVHEEALRAFPDLKTFRIFLCGHPSMVKETQRQAYLSGAALHNIFADAFTVGEVS